CTIVAASELDCPPSNVTCLCSNGFWAAVSPCIQTHCSVREALTATNITADTCNWPSSNRQQILKVIPLVSGTVATMAVGSRLAGHHTAKTRLKTEDYLTIIAWVSRLRMAENGMGRNIWDIPQEKISYILKLFYIDEILYITCICLTKIAILLYFARVFSPILWFRIAVRVSITTTTLYNITFVIALALQCVPVTGAWTAWDGTFRGTFIDLKVMWWVAAALNIAFDFGIMSLPFWPLRELQMSLKIKIQIGLMLGVGFFVTMVSILRLQSLLQFGNTTNPTYDHVPLGYWSTLEMCFGLVVTCMPSVRLLLLHVFPQL
ncbi:hypothetical protein OIDMADRAFT_65044, partial [Oidiodendron maius Zn]